MYRSLLDYVSGRECAILGLGVSNLPLARILTREGIKLNIYDKKSAEELGEDAVALRRAGADFFVADKDFDGLRGELIFRSPGVRPDVKGIADAVARGAELTSEMELFLKLTPAHTLAVTGSDGKTTTTTLTGKFLAACGRKTYVGGNIGTPLLDKCGQMTCDDNAVLELSSFQLMTLVDSPERVAITNISPNHLDWHTGMDEYVRAKKNVIGGRTRRLVTNAECVATLDIAREVSGRDGIDIVLFSSKRTSHADIFGDIAPRGRAIAVYVKGGSICVCDGEREWSVLDLSRIKILGIHNVENYMTAIGLTYGDVPYDIYASVAESFFGVEHRLEFVRTLDGVDYYNGSIDSSPTRTAAALSALSDRRIVLICGGYDKNIPYAPLAKAICEHGGVYSVVLTGATGDKIGREIALYADKHPELPEVSLYREPDFASAVKLARSVALFGDCVLLSPASASFDAFRNFAERGNTFKRIVMEF